MGYNMFAYCGNNPVCFTDFCGYAWSKISFDAFNPLDGGMFSPCSGGGSVAGGIAIIKAVRESAQENNSSEYQWSWYDSGEIAFGPFDNYTYQIQGAIVSYNTPSLNGSGMSLGSLYVAGTEGHLGKAGDDISLLNFGVSELEASIGCNGIELTAMASIWKPEVIINCGFCSIDISANIGSIGGAFECKPGKIAVGAAAGIGCTISIEW